MMDIQRHDPDRLLNEREAAALLGYTVRALQKFACAAAVRST